MNIFACWPSATMAKAAQCHQAWSAMGYRCGIFFDKGKPQCVVGAQDFILAGKYQGYPLSANKLAQYAVIAHDADIVVLMGDDMLPDPTHRAEEIGAEFMERFPDTFGVLQPTGDMQGIDETGKPAAARICGSGWYGRAWIERAYMGMGPVWGGYAHFYFDEEIQMVASMRSAYEQRPDLIQMHNHWSFGKMARQPYHEAAQKHWKEDQKKFTDRRDAGFPYSEPL